MLILRRKKVCHSYLININSYYFVQNLYQTVPINWLSPIRDFSVRKTEQDLFNESQKIYIPHDNYFLKSALIKITCRIYKESLEVL